MQFSKWRTIIDDEMNIDDYDKINAKTVGKTQKVYLFPVSPKMITTENG